MDQNTITSTSKKNTRNQKFSRTAEKKAKTTNTSYER